MLENLHLGNITDTLFKGADAATGIINALNNNQPAQSVTPTATVTGQGVAIPAPAADDSSNLKLAIIGGVVVVGLVAAIIIAKR